MENKEEINANGIEYLKKIGIKEVSNKTFIHEEELKKFLDSDFTGINKTKAMGFIQILEREFRIDLSDLKSQYIDYLNENSEEIKPVKQSLMMEEVQNEERKKGFFSFLFLIASIGTIAYLIDKYNLLDFSTPSDIKTAQISSEIKDVELNLGKLSQPEKPQIVEKVKKEEVIVASEAKNNSDISDIIEKDKNNEEKNLELKDILSSDEAIEKKDTSNINNNEELDLSKLNSELKTDSEDIEKNDQTINELVEDNSENNSTEAITNEIYIIPNSKVWIGTIDLDTLKKKDFLAPKGKRVDIDTSINKLIMIGHKFIKIYLNGELVKFKRRGPIRFKYIDGELTEINRKEFNKLAKGRQW